LGLQLDPPLTSEIAEVKEASHPVRYEAIDICLEQDACISVVVNKKVPKMSEKNPHLLFNNYLGNSST
jgi:hypothetical protein